MSFYRAFPVTPPRGLDLETLRAELHATDPSIGIQAAPGEQSTITIKQAADFTPERITAIEAAIAATPTLTPGRATVHAIDTWPPDQNALVLVLLEQLNVIRAALVPPLPPLPPPAIFDAIRHTADPQEATPCRSH